MSGLAESLGTRHCNAPVGLINSVTHSKIIPCFSNGITGYLYGPISGRENDIAVLNMSWVNTQLLMLQEEVTAALARGEDVVYFALFSDSIFPYHLCITQLIDMSHPWVEFCMRGWKR
jgi:hypothetical protein